WIESTIRSTSFAFIAVFAFCDLIASPPCAGARPPHSSVHQQKTGTIPYVPAPLASALEANQMPPAASGRRHLLIAVADRLHHNAFHDASRTCRNSAKNRFATQLTLVQSNKSIGPTCYCQGGDFESSKRAVGQDDAAPEWNRT